jgi:superfamily II DNA helicase RecQ
MKFSASSFLDLSILVPEGLSAADPHPPGFIVYVNSRLDAQHATKYLRSRVAKDMADMIVYVHAGMSELHHNEAVLGFTQGIIIAIIATEALGLVCQK